MIMTYIKFVAALVMLAHPVAYDVDRGHVGDAVAVTWSPTSPSRPAPRSEKAQVHRATAIRADESKTALSARAAKQAKPNSSDLPPARIADLQPAAKTTADPGSAEASSAVSPPAKAATADSDFNAGTTQQQVTAAMVVAEQLTAATAASIDADHLVAILMTRPEIKSVSDLAGKTVAIDGRQFNGNVRTAIAAAGATAVQLSEDQTKAIDRLINGEVPAAVLTLVSPEAADGFPDVAGFRIFRVPLSPRSLQRG
jgi:hypothetical protein